MKLFCINFSRFDFTDGPHTFHLRHPDPVTAPPITPGADHGDELYYFLPATGQEPPFNEKPRSSTDFQPSATDDQPSSADSQSPSTGEQHTATGEKPSITNNEPMTADSQNSATADQRLTTDEQLLASAQMLNILEEFITGRYLHNSANFLVGALGRHS